MFASLSLCALSLAAAAAPLRRGPYLVDASSTSARICWRDATEHDACADYNDLEPGADFGYTIPGVEGSWKARTLPKAGKPLRFAVIGDSGRGGNDQRRVAATLEHWAPDLVLIAGDIVYPRGADKDYDAKYFKPYARLLPSVPFFPAPGNHDYGNSQKAEKGRRRWTEGYGRVFRRWPYYSFDAGGAHFAVLDSNNEGFGILAAPNLGPGSTQRAWLERDLAGSKARWKFVLMHVPLYSTGYHGGNPDLEKSLAPLFTRHKVDAVFQGHDHDYERTDALGGTVYFVVGTGGAGLRAPKSTAPWSAKTVTEFGFLAVTLDGSSAQFEFYDAEGVLRDSARLTK